MAVITKRVKQDGTVRWRMRVFAGRDDDGRQTYVVRTFDRKKDAEAEARRLERMKDHGGMLTPTSKEPLGDYLARWLGAKEGEIRARTIHDYRGVVRRWITNPPDGAPEVRRITLDRLRQDAFDALYAYMRDRGLAPRTIQYLHVVLRQALKDAVRRKALVSNPTDFVKVPKRAKDSDDVEDGKKAVRALTKDEAQRFLEAARSDRYHALWCVLLLGGLRPSEALGLGWEHIDFAAGRVHVQRTLTRIGVKGWKLVPTKTAKARRAVPLPAVAMHALRAWKAKQAEERLKLGAEWQDHGFVFTTTFGNPWDSSNLAGRPFRRVMARAALGEWRPRPPAGARGPRGQGRFKPAYRLYDLRHTCATLLLLAGENAKVVQERLGHASITLTLDTYSHVLPSMQEGAAAKLDAMFGTG